MAEVRNDAKKSDTLGSDLGSGKTLSTQSQDPKTTNPITGDPRTEPLVPGSFTPGREDIAREQLILHTDQKGVYNPNKFKQTINGSSRENTRAALEGMFNVPERFRGAISSMVDNLGMGAYEVTVDSDMDGETAHFHIDIKRIEAKEGDPVSADGRDPLSPLGQATLPYKAPEAERLKNMPKTAEERDAKAKQEGKVGAPIYGSQTKENPAGIPSGQPAARTGTPPPQSAYGKPTSQASDK